MKKALVAVVVLALTMASVVHGQCPGGSCGVPAQAWSGGMGHFMPQGHFFAPQPNLVPVRMAIVAQALADCEGGKCRPNPACGCCGGCSRGPTCGCTSPVVVLPPIRRATHDDFACFGRQVRGLEKFVVRMEQ
jgi:hypothetical protein